MHRMTLDERLDLLARGLDRLEMTMDDDACAKVSNLSQGLPYYAHLVARSACKSAVLQNLSRRVDMGALNLGVSDATNQIQHTLLNAYETAVHSSRPDATFREVLLACALAEKDELGYFSTTAVRGPLRAIKNRPDLDVGNYNGPLTKFLEDVRGPVLTRIGTARNYRWRFIDPMLAPYVVLRSVNDEVIDVHTAMALTAGMRH